MAAPQPETTPSAGYTPVLTDLWRLVRAPFVPKTVYGEQEAAPTFWIPWLLVSAGFFVLQFLQRPFQQRIRDLVLQKVGQPVPTGGASLAGLLVGIASTFVIVLVLASIAAGIYYLVLMVFGGQTTFKRMLTVTIFAWPIAILQALLTYVALSIRGVESIQSVWDVQVSFGADLLLPSDTTMGAFARLFLAGIGPLAIWQLIVTVIGLKTLGKASTGAAWTAALVTFFVLLVGLAALGAVGINAALKAMGS